MQPEKYPWIYDLLLFAVLAVAAFLRLSGADWGELQHQHPDELFLSSVVGNLRAHECKDPAIAIDSCPPELQKWIGLDDYFDTETSTLNPHNRGYAFFVYGTLPLFIVRFTAEITGNPGFDALKLLGRQFSAYADLGTILLLYFIVARLYNRKTALLTTAFSAFAVMQIQQSHFFTTDTFVNLFSFLAIYFAVEILESKEQRVENSEAKQLTVLKSLLSNHLFWLSIAFGLAYGMAMASKVNIFPLALLLPGAFAVRLIQNKEERERLLTADGWKVVLVSLLAGGMAAFIAFRIFQPYAFDGLLPSEQWLANIAEQRVQARGDADLPWNLQWARRTHLYSFQNLTIWGLGLPLGILAWAGFLYMGWRIIKGKRKHLLLWGWTAIYFTWQSLQFNPTMRYQLPIYPLLAMMAAWFVGRISDFKLKIPRPDKPVKIKLRPFAIAFGLLALAATAAWAFAFQSIYTRPEPRIAASRWIYQNVPAPLNLRIQRVDGTTYSQPMPVFQGAIIEPGTPYQFNFRANATGQLTEIYLPHITDTSASGTQTLSLFLSDKPDAPPESALAAAALTADFHHPQQDIRGEAFSFRLDKPLPLAVGQSYFIHLETSGGTIMLAGSNVANETDYDFTLPFRVDGYDGFGGLYTGNTLQVYWDDNEEKMDRYSAILNASDFIFIPTNHQYAQITRLPERYPLTTLYYRELMGCPAEITIIKCYREAQPGMYTGNLGFELASVFESYPQLGPIVINDQPAEEAFTFYDHPKVLIFKKRADYNPAQVLGILSTVDLNQVVHLTPRQAGSYEYKDLMLTPDRLTIQRVGGTWSEMFDYDWAQNKHPWIGLIIWYAFVFVLGAFTYPLVRLVLPGLSGKGYPLARTLGLVILAYVPWLLGSLNAAPYSRTTIGLVFASIVVAGCILGWTRRHELAEEWKSNRRFFLIVEILFLAFFIFDLLIRIGNPDLWHPSKGGERPMDFSYFNAVLKSTTFPPFDPWFAGGYINYYYYGFVLVGTPVKLLGIVPSIAYNFILPTLFAMVAVSAFGVGWNLVERGRWKEGNLLSSLQSLPFISGMAAALMMVVLGNLGTIRMVYQAVQRIAAPGGVIDGATIIQEWSWAAQGLWKSLTGTPLPLSRGDWYWISSRVIPPGPGNEITEFPFFTFLYSDLHAHMIVLVMTLFVIAWALGTIRAGRTSLTSIFFGALVIGALYPTNLSDIYTYLPIGMTALLYMIWKARDVPFAKRLPNLSPQLKKILAAVISTASLTLLSFWLYEPYRAAYSQSYSKVDVWTASQTPISSYLTHWGLFLFIAFAWLAWETRQWMAVTPVSALKKLKPYQLWLDLAIGLFVAILLYLTYRKIFIGWIALPLGAWAGILMLRPNQPDHKRLALFWIGTALLITIVVELITVRGDIGRMNTIFKFYLQAWTLLSVSGGAAFTWTLMDLHTWRARWRNAWQVALLALFTGAALYTVTASIDKINDRLNPNAPHSLDTMEYMAHSELWDGEVMDLSQDYRAIRWLQDTVKGSPAIVEANVTEYRWGTRYTIYTGLPGVVGWNWHQRQQRPFMSNLVTDRVAEVVQFYLTTDVAAAHDFLRKYDVHYIIVGQFERILYPDGLAKFETYDGIAWKSVYKDRQTTIYEVVP